MVVIALVLAAGTLPAQDSLKSIVKRVRPGKEVMIQKGYSDWEHGILFWHSEDEAFYGRFDVRAFLNGAYFFENLNELSNGTHLRKGRFAIKMQLWRQWRVEWDIDVAEGIVELKDMWLSYNHYNTDYIKFGHFKVPFGLEILTTSRYIPFPERAYNALAFKMGRRMGIEYGRWGRWWNVRADLFGQTFDTRKNKTIDETGGGFAARFAATPINKNNKFIVHTGLAAVYEVPDDNAWIVSYNAEPETKIGDVEILDTGAIKDVNYTIRTGLEGAVAWNGWHFQGEYQMVNLYRRNGQTDASFDGGYLYVLYNFSGQTRPWDPTQGEFGQLIPNNPYKGGLWEVGLRYSHMNLSDADAGKLGGKANNYTAAVNWYPNANMVFQFNYTMVQNSNNATGDGFIGGDEFSYLQFMVKFFF